MRIFALAFISLLFSLEVFGQSATLTTSAPANLGGSRWSGFSALGYSTNMYESQSYSSNTSAFMSAVVNYRVTGPNLIRASVSGSKDLNHSEENKLNDGFVGWVNNSFWLTSKVLNIGQQVRAIVPLSKDSRERDGKLTGIAVAPVFVLNLTPVGVRGLSLVYQPQGTKNFHTYKQNRDFQTNPEYGLSQMVMLTWAATDNFYIQPMFIYGYSWSYGGTRRDDSYQLSLETGYSILSSTTIAIGVTNSGLVRNFENATDQTIQVYDRRTASVYSSLYYSF